MMPQLVQQLMLWPIYVTDENQVQCYANNGEAEHDEQFLDYFAGRRGTVADFFTALQKHILDHHKFNWHEARDCANTQCKTHYPDTGLFAMKDQPQ